MATYIDPRLKNISLNDLCPREKWVKNNKRRECHLCSRKFTTTKRKHHCRVCGEVVCDSCTQKCTMPLYQSRIFSSKLRICMKCLHSKDKSLKTSRNFMKELEVQNEPRKERHPLSVTSPVSSPVQVDVLEVVNTDDPYVVWHTVWSSFAIFLTATCDQIEWFHRVCVITIVYTLFLMYFVKKSKTSSRTPPQATPATSISPRMEIPSTSSTSLIFIDIPLRYQKDLSSLYASFRTYYLPNSAWKLVNTQSDVSYYKMSISNRPPAHKVIAFIPSMLISDFLKIIITKNKSCRLEWDINMKDHQVIEEYNNLAISYNSQNSFLGGFVSPRDFCLLSYRTENTHFMQSVLHEKIPEKAGHVRGHMYFSGMKCDAATYEGISGFWITYIVHADIKGSLPQNVVANGTMEAMVKLIRVIQKNKHLVGKL